MIYQKDSSKAEEFIPHEEILDTLEYAKNNKDNRALIEQLIEKASHCKGLSHREAALLLECNQPDLIERIFHLAKEIKQKFYGNRIVMFAPCQCRLHRQGSADDSGQRQDGYWDLWEGRCRRGIQNR